LAAARERAEAHAADARAADAGAVGLAISLPLPSRGLGLSAAFAQSGSRIACGPALAHRSITDRGHFASVPHDHESNPEEKDDGHPEGHEDDGFRVRARR
jgi:hypothetical protein